MKQDSLSQAPAPSPALLSLRDALARQKPDIAIDERGYADTFRDTLLPLVSVEDFEAGLSAGDGNELETKFRAAHSSAGLAVNCFAPFRSRLGDLAMPMGSLYLYSEPDNPKASPEFARHRAEIAAFAERVDGSTPAFAAMSYPELWQFWRQTEPADWLVRHLGDLRARYAVTL